MLTRNVRRLAPIGLLIGIALFAGRGLFAADLKLVTAAMNSIQAEGLKNHTLFLASDTLEGREAGSKGGHAAGAYLLDILKKSGLKAKGDGGFFTQEFGDDYRNLLAYLPGTDPELADEVIVVGAHYDHVGYGNSQNSFGPLGQIHNGADDNASGVSGLVEIIHAVSNHSLELKRPVLFAFWDAEEKGLLGSEHWIDQPTLPLSSVAFYVNVDMIGRLPERGLTMYGVRTATGLRQWVAEQNRATDVVIRFDWTIKRDSDHYPFYQKGIPFLMLHTGLHDDYHRPSDDPEKLNWQGMEQSSRLMFQLVVSAADADRLPAFRLQATREKASDQAERNEPAPPAPPRLGVTWDRDLEKQGIIEIADVRLDSAADRAGLKAGDRILKVNKTEIEAATGFIRLIARAQNPVEFVVLRTGETQPITIAAELDGSPVRLGIAWRIDPAEPGTITIVRVDPASPAADANLDVGDRIVRAAGEPVSDSQQFADLVAATEGELELLREREGRLETVSVRLGEDGKGE